MLGIHKACLLEAEWQGVNDADADDLVEDVKLTTGPEKFVAEAVIKLSYDIPLADLSEELLGHLNDRETYCVICEEEA